MSKPLTEPAKWVKDEGTWSKAKKAVRKNWGDYDEPWAVVTYVYKKMGGAIASTRGEAEPPSIKDGDLAKMKKYLPEYSESNSSSALGQLTRAGVKPGKKEACKGTCKTCRGCTFPIREGARRVHFIQLREAKIDREKRTVRCVMVSVGPGNEVDKNYYGERGVMNGPKAFNGMRCYINHQTEAQRRAIPEGDIWSLAGFWSDVTVETVKDKKTGKTVPACVGTLTFDRSETGEAGLAKAEAAIEYAKLFPDSPDVYAGLSINTGGLADGEVTIEGEQWHNIVDFEHDGSVDIVTKPARGGAFQRLMESMRNGKGISKAEAAEMKITKIKRALAEARKERAELLKKEADPADVQKVDDKVDELLGQLTGDGAGDDGTKIERMAKLVDKREGESDEEYAERLKAAIAEACGEEESEDEGEEGEGDEKGEKPPVVPAKSGESVKDIASFRKANPEKYAALMEHARVKLTEERKDFSTLKSDLREAKVEIRILKDTQLAARLLEEADLPEGILEVQDLIGKSEDEMKREIGRYTKLIGSRESMGPGFPRTASGSGSNGGVDPTQYGCVVKENKK